MGPSEKCPFERPIVRANGLRHATARFIRSTWLRRFGAQMQSKLRRRHAGLLPEEMAEIMFAGEAQPFGDFLDPQTRVREKRLRQVHAMALQVIVHRLVHVPAKQRAERRVMQTRMLRQLARFPIAERIGGKRVDCAGDLLGEVGLIGGQELARDEAARGRASQSATDGTQRPIRR